MTVGVGVLGLIPASSALQMPGWRIAIHALFGLMLCALVVARFRWRVKHSALMTSEDIGALSQHLARIVYWLLYGVVGMRLIVSIVSSGWHGAAIDVDPFHESFGAEGRTSGAKADFGQFFVAGLLGRAFVYVLVLKVWRGSAANSKLSG